ncbi:MAG: DUF1631 domain-containing protein [Gammaproteobacteria bacterium]|nr:DUF1631 domain-containing protein [Gammaproteobacteria bacterium]
MSAEIHNFETARNKAAMPDNISKVISEFINNDADNLAKKGATALRARAGNVYARQEVVKALSKLQSTYKQDYIPGQQVNINTDSFKKALLNSMAKLGNSTMTKSVNQIDSRTIDFVEMIFGAFLRDKNISDTIKSLLLKLQIPVIKIALLDMKFFHNDKHPARLLLDSIAHLGIGIEDINNTLYKTMEMILNQLINTFDQNIVSFNTALKALERLGSNEKLSQEKNEKETRQIILKEHARQIILAELQFHLKDKILPKSSQQLVLRNWSTLMFHSYARHGKQSDEWNEAINILKLLIKTLQPPKNRGEYLSLKDNHMALVHTINDMLGETKQNKELIHNAIHSLKLTYQNLLEASEFKSITYSDGINKSKPLHSEYKPDEDTGPSPIEQAIAEAQNKIEQLPEAVKPGVWFEIYVDNDKPVRRLKLSVIVQEDAKLVFVDRLGVKVMEKDAVDFATELDVGQSHILADHSIFDHALSNVISSLAAAH